jgi:hypothetical protein
VEEYVLGLDELGGSDRNLVFRNTDDEPTLVVANGLFEVGSSMTDIKKKMIGEYLHIIQQRKFSKNGNLWTTFTEEDYTFINKALDSDE